MKKYKVTAYALNHVWYREEWLIEAESQEDAITKAESQEGDLIEEGKGNVETCRARFDFDHIEELEKALINAVFLNKNKTLNGFSARSRHSKLLALSLKETLIAESLCDETSIELCAEHLKIASNLLGQIQNPYSSDDLLGEIFSSFCIGK